MSNALLNPDDRTVTIYLPDLFKGFLVHNPMVNPHYETARSESEIWLQR